MLGRTHKREDVYGIFSIVGRVEGDKGWCRDGFVILSASIYRISLKCAGKKVRGRSSMYSISCLFLDFYKCAQ